MTIYIFLQVLHYLFEEWISKHFTAVKVRSSLRLNPNKT